MPLIFLQEVYLPHTFRRTPVEHEFGVRPLAILSSLTSNGAQNNDSHFHEATDENALGFIETHRRSRWATRLPA